MDKKLIEKINNLRIEIRTDYEKIAKELYEIIKSFDDYLEDLSKRLENAEDK
jgi:hypothetical protein